MYASIRHALQDSAFLHRESKREELLIEMFTGSLPEEDRQRVLSEFSKEDSIIRCLVASIAFGMAVDIPDIAYTVLWGATATVLDMWQEIGRAGRNGQPAQAYLYLTPQTVSSPNTEPALKNLVKQIREKKIACLRQALLQLVT